MKSPIASSDSQTTTPEMPDNKNGYPAAYVSPEFAGDTVHGVLKCGLVGGPL